MSEVEIQEQRRSKWRIGRPARTLEEASEFVQSVGLCLVHPVNPPLLAPTFLGAYTGSDHDLPTAQQAYRDPRVAEARELMVRLLRQRLAYEANIEGEGTLLLSPQTFPYFYALVGDRNPKKDLRSDIAGRKISPLTQDAFAIIQREGPISNRHLAEVLGGAPSEAALDRSLTELWSHLRITRVDYRPQEGVLWDVLYRWSPDAVKEGIGLSVGEGLSALLSKYLEAVIAAEQGEIEAFFQPMVARSRVREAIHALLAARQFSFMQAGGRTLIQNTPPVEPRQRNFARTR
ncbi:MAG TPA: hypothetical protein VFA71_13290 [Terriglobales bacterium]|nr:hypothetical protein [Terriglobales bacterium]